MVYDDITTASPDEIVDRAKKILEFVQRNRGQFLQMDKAKLQHAMEGVIEWLTAFVIRLGNDIKGKPVSSETDVQKQIAEWAKEVERFLV